METAAKLMVRLQRYEEAAEALHTALQLYSQAGGGGAAGRVVLSLVLVQVRFSPNSPIYWCPLWIILGATRECHLNDQLECRMGF